MRDRLIELLKEADRYTSDKGITDYNEAVTDNADYLLANVIVAPMPMADWLREELSEYVHKRCVEEL